MEIAAVVNIRLDLPGICALNYQLSMLRLFPPTLLTQLQSPELRISLLDTRLRCSSESAVAEKFLQFLLVLGVHDNSNGGQGAGGRRQGRGFDKL